MKKIRLFALLCAIVLTLSLAPMASAATRSRVAVDGVFSWDNTRMIKNGETASFNVASRPYSMNEIGKNGKYDTSIYWNDLDFDCEGKVSAKSSVSWIKIQDTKSRFIITIENNTTKNVRSGIVTVTGKNYKATLKFKQFGFDEIVSAKQNKKKVTIKFKYSKGCDQHMLYIDRYQDEYNEKTQTSKFKSETVYNGPITKSSYTFTVKEGWNYSISLSPAINIKYEWGDSTYTYSADNLYFYVDSVAVNKVIR